MQVTEALKILEPLLENQGSFPIRIKKGSEDLGRVAAIGSSIENGLNEDEYRVYFVPEKNLNSGECFCIKDIYDALSKHKDCELTVDKYEILNFANGLIDMGDAMYFGGCSVFV